MDTQELEIVEPVDPLSFEERLARIVDRVLVAPRWTKALMGLFVAGLIALFGFSQVETLARGSVEDSIPPVGVVSTTTTSVARLITVDVAGEVREPGVHSLKVGSRVIDAIEAAGGLTGHADRDRVNLAAELLDGSQVAVPHIATKPSVTLPPSPYLDFASGTNALVDPNTASIEELQTLSGVGPTLANAIAEYRANKKFASAEDLLEVSGIGPAKLEKMVEELVFDSAAN